MRKLYIILLLILVFTAITKPSEDSFNEYLKTELKTKIDDDILTKIVKGISKVQSNLTTKYHDKIFYSISETSIGGEKHKFLGICGFWFELR